MQDKKYEYLSASMAGTYWVPCQVIGETHISYTITYVDPFINEEVTRQNVEKDRVKEVK